ncbi:amino acid ABC transporter permease [Actinokineospora globicatena]|uniref:Glutamate ABC transporter permease n=1 Tax=Actinokineospora globicatena TaxID=103729 RepID=A0A9W6QNA7_9PSEU|nr:amino acid ABC transporter permease [Actinokineospora globicatena]MCP2302572.1 glutamate transport system permease protein [Actinokineospora globicatena]GLW75741.1 glutamate ABC transporter permease [Actinokineospora globicatena]GLW82581.1 glutamate ABC transporter permease [Actinokineospora globicatena]GLW91528.1 glutamate ABC transporter permease [Actinokineospora globicatena]
MSTTSVLFDAPGPRSKRRVLIGSVIAGLLLLGVLVLVGLRLDAQHQFDVEKWAPLFDPSDEQFPLVWQRIGEALGNTLVAAALAMVFSLVIGTLLAVTRVTAARWYRWAVVGLVELLRGVPVVIAIFFASRVLPQFGLDLEPLWFLVIGLTAYNSVIIAEIVRAGIDSLPKGQREAAESLGLRRGQVLSLVLLPQAFRVMLPAVISQLVVVLKDTSLGFVISYEELVRVAGQIVQVLSNPIQVYLLIAVIFTLINYTLSRFAIWVERRLSQGKKSATATLSATDPAGAGTGGG